MTRRTKSDWELWERVKKTAKPLLRGQAVPENFEALFEEPTKPPNRPLKNTQSKSAIRPVPSQEPAIQFNQSPDLPKLDQPTAKKIAKGRLPIEDRIDLHGLTQNEAYARLLRFIESRQRNGVRTVLVITGKGSRGEGVLRQAVPRWLAENDFRKMVIGHHESHQNHGGTGAIYVRLRKR